VVCVSSCSFFSFVGTCDPTPARLTQPQQKVFGVLDKVYVIHYSRAGDRRVRMEATLLAAGVNPNSTQVLAGVPHGVDDAVGGRGAWTFSLLSTTTLLRQQKARHEPLRGPSRNATRRHVALKVEFVTAYDREDIPPLLGACVSCGEADSGGAVCSVNLKVQMIEERPCAVATASAKWLWRLPMGGAPRRLLPPSFSCLDARAFLLLA
jgi:hypothetical protein